jgi:hypothetical protein
VKASEALAARRVKAASGPGDGGDRIGIRRARRRAKLSGFYDFELTYNPEGLSTVAADAGVDILDAVEQQFGLKLERRAPYEVLVVESVRRPTAKRIARLCLIASGDRPRVVTTAAVEVPL